MTGTYKETTIYTPTNFDAYKLLKEEGWKDFLIERHKQKFEFFLHQIYINRITNKKYNKNDFVSLSYQHHFQRFLSCRYTPLIKAILLKHKIIEVFNPFDQEHAGQNRKIRYQVASPENNFTGETMGYRLAKEYNVKHRQSTLDFYTTLHKNVIKYKEKDLNNQDWITQNCNEQVQKIGIKKLEALRHVENWYTNNIKNLDLVKLKKKQVKILNKIKDKNAREKYIKEILDFRLESYLHSIYAFSNETCFPAIRDKKGTRIHTQITVLWKELRQFLFIKNEPGKQIYSLDVANCQPFCLIKIINENFPDGNLPEDAKKYIALVSKGEFYKYLGSKMAVPLKDMPEFKTTLFANVFYSTNAKGFDTKEAIAFREEFSTVYQIIQQAKREIHNNLAIEMQKIEAQVILEGVLNTLMNKFQNDFFSSIHDSILCLEEHVGEVKNLLINHFRNEVGYSPLVRIEKL